MAGGYEADMKILFVHGETKEIAGGAETLLRDQAEELYREGHEVAWYHGPGDFRETARLFKPDICHLLTIHCYPIGMEPAIILQEQGIPRVWHIQDYWPFCKGRMLLIGDKSCPAVEGVCDNSCLEMADPSYLEICNRSFIVAGNENTKDIYLRNGLRCDAVVELGVDTELFSPGQPTGKLKLYTSCGWPDHVHKGMHVLREALKGLDYEVTLAYTGELTMTGARVKIAASKYLGGGSKRRFLLGADKDGWHIDAGLTAFIMTRKDYNNERPFLAALPFVSIGTSQFAINATYIPAVSPKTEPLWFFQASVQVAKW